MPTVARAVAHVEGEPGELDLVAILEPAVRPESAHRREAVFRGLFRQGLDQEKVVLVRPFDRNAKVAGEVPGSRRVIEMAMRQQNLLDGHADLRRRLLDPFEVAARIAHGAAHVFVIPQKRAVLLERCDGENGGLQAHGGNSFAYGMSLAER